MKKRIIIGIGLVILIFITAEYTNLMRVEINEDNSFDELKIEEIYEPADLLGNNQDVIDSSGTKKEEIDESVGEEVAEVTDVETNKASSNDNLVISDDKKSNNVKANPMAKTPEKVTTSEVAANTKRVDISVVSSSPPVKVVVPTKEEIEKKIETKYLVVFNQLKVRFEGALNELLQQGMNEYTMLKKKKKNFSKIKLGAKYIKRGRALEKQCDAEFDMILAQMQQELISNSIDSDLCKKAKKQYNDEKKERQQMLLEKALK